MSRRPEKTFPPPQRRHTNDKQAHEEIVTLLIIRKMQIKIIMRYPLTPVRMTILQKITNVGKDIGKGEPLYTVGWNINLCNYYGKVYIGPSKF